MTIARYDLSETSVLKPTANGALMHYADHCRVVEAAEFYAQAVKKMYEQSYDDLGAAKARITALEAEKALLQAKYEASEIDKKLHWTCDHEHWQQRITQLEGALKAVIKEIESNMSLRNEYQDFDEALKRAQHALTPKKEDV
jgi:hypothetical protein